MVEKRTYAEVLLVIALMASLGVNITQEDATDNIYSCDIETIDDLYCFKLSKFNSAGIQRNCYYNKESPRKYKVCSSGWDKTTLEEALKKEVSIIKINDVNDANKWCCSSGDTCIPGACKG